MPLPVFIMYGEANILFVRQSKMQHQFCEVKKYFTRTKMFKMFCHVVAMRNYAWIRFCDIIQKKSIYGTFAICVAYVSSLAVGGLQVKSCINTSALKFSQWFVCKKSSGRKNLHLFDWEDLLTSTYGGRSCCTSVWNTQKWCYNQFTVPIH